VSYIIFERSKSEHALAAAFAALVIRKDSKATAERQWLFLLR
jgi:hypothetical protein